MSAYVNETTRQKRTRPLKRDRGLPIIRRMRPGPIRVGQDFGPRYHVQKLLGSGGMGVVYQALDRELNVEIALKVLRAPVPGTKTVRSMIEMQRRLRTELVLARQITHRHVIRIHDIGDVNGIRFISMPLVKGPDLASMLKSGRLKSARAVRYARQLAAGLMAVHAAGVVHRDIKPGNIMIDEGDSAVLMDFGIARSNAPSGGPKTIAGGAIGTPAYMAPEQARGEAVDPRTDIYAFGLVLYEMLTGPRADMSIGDLASRMKAAPTPAHHVNPRVPKALSEIATRCLQPAREARYQTSIELAQALAAVGRRATRDVGSGPNMNWVKHAAAVLILALLAAAGYKLLTKAGGTLLASSSTVHSTVRRGGPSGPPAPEATPDSPIVSVHDVSRALPGAMLSGGAPRSEPSAWWWLPGLGRISGGGAEPATAYEPAACFASDAQR